MYKSTSLFLVVLLLESMSLKSVTPGETNDYLVIDDSMTETQREYDEEIRDRAQRHYDAWGQRRANFREGSIQDSQLEEEQIRQRDRERDRIDQERLQKRELKGQHFWQEQMKARELQREEEIKAREERRLEFDEDPNLAESQDEGLVSEIDPFSSDEFWDQQEKERKNSKRRATSVQINVRRYGTHAPQSKED